MLHQKYKYQKFDNKKAAISIEFIVILIILVVSFVVILLFYYAFDWKGEIDKEACHQSVIYKATVPKAMLDQKLVEIPLNCKTEKICISENSEKGACDSDYAGEKYQIIELKETNSDKRNEEINKILADKMYECWWMMGQGKLELYSRNFLQKKTCVICTRIAFSKELQNKLEKVPGILTYLKENTINPNLGQTYEKYLTNSGSLNFNSPQDFITTRPHAIIFAEVDEAAWQKWTARTVGTVGSAALAGAAIGSIVGPVGGVIGAGVGGIIGFLGTGEISTKIDQFLNKKGVVANAWQIVDYDVPNLKYLQCASFDGTL